MPTKEEDEAARVIQRGIKGHIARKQKEKRQESPSVASRAWKEQSSHGTLKEAILKLDKLKAQFSERAKVIAEEKAELIKLKTKEPRELLRGKIEGFAKKRIEIGLDNCKPAAVNAVTDPFMPMFLQKLIATTVDAIWPDVQEEVLNAIMNIISPPADVIPALLPSSCWGRFIAKCRYFLYPYDKTTWQQLREPLTILYKIICLVPVAGVAQFIFLCHLIIIDREDEYQLVNYILQFKALLFVTLGIIGSIVGGIQYYLCMQDLTGVDEDQSCSKTAPREQLHILGIFVFQVILVWIAFLKIRTSQRKGGAFYLNQEYRRASGVAGPDTSAEEVREKKTRRRLMKWLFFDVFVCLLCVGLALFAAFNGANSSHGRITRNGITNWRFEASLYMIKCIYGLLSFPFLFLKLPVLGALLSHARRTAYTPTGQCVPYKGPQIDENSGEEKAPRRGPSITDNNVAWAEKRNG
eukprot:TRINITY_DN9982_c0_g1_i1.p1 TRINITY_DN9982_c0_g1~~TRINITY_DN9982_c0_g1_i1.p1  ORF type:complete len:467 (+),score=51.80 TRINITY_DN9982_c0_g1_i1:65-1465(+)